MRKILFIMILFAILLSCSSCSNNMQVATNQIIETQLTDREKMILSTGYNKYFAFDFNIDDTYNWIGIWLERYENGEMISDSEVLSKYVSANEKGMILITVDEDKDLNTKWIATVESGGGKGSSKFTVEYDADINSILSYSWSANGKEITAITNNKFVLGSMLYKFKDTSMSFLSEDFYDDPDNNIEELLEYDLAFIIKCKFYNIPEK